MTYGHFIDGHIKDNPTCYAAHVAAQTKIADQNKARFFGGSTKPANAKADGGSRAPAFDPAEKRGLQKPLDPIEVMSEAKVGLHAFLFACCSRLVLWH